MRALVLSGGGSRGAFQAGAIYGLAKRGISWDLVAGVSVGALNGTLMAQYPPAKHLEAAERLRDMWMGIKGNKSIYKSWALGPLMGLWKGGLYNTEPLKKLVYSNFDPVALAGSGVKLRIGAVSFETGEYRYVTEVTENLRDWILASAAFPVAFPPVKIDGQSWIDGGVRDVTPLRDVNTEPGVTGIDIVLTGSVSGQVDVQDGKKASSAISVGLRAIDLMGNEVYRNDVTRCSGLEFNVDGASPEFKFPSPLDFSPESIRLMFAEGERASAELVLK